MKSASQPPVARASGLIGYARSFGVGSAFAVGWTPCIGPILGAILALAASSATVLKGTFLLSAWSLGLGLPFLVAGLMLGQMMRGMRRLRPVMPVLEVLGGALVILIGALIFFDRFTVFNQYFGGGVSTVTSAEEGIGGISVQGPIGFVAAFGAGIVAFLSPCCLPMVPAYLAHLAGVSAEDGGATRMRTFRHALAFVLGFSAVFVALGASVAAVGYVVRDNLPILEKIAGAMLMVMGLNLLGIIKIPWLYRTYQLEFGADDPASGLANQAPEASEASS